jgi:hypothetical protein
MQRKPVDVYLNVYGGEGDGTLVMTRQFSVSPGLSTVTARERTDLVKLMLKKTLEWFGAKYLPLRFTGYATENLDYKVLPSTWRKKRAKAQTHPGAMRPNTFTGQTEKRVNAFRVTTAGEGGATSGKVNARVVTGQIPQGRNKQTNRCVKTVTPAEAARIAMMFQSLMEAAARRVTQTEVTTRSGQIRIRNSLDRLDAIQIVSTVRGRGGRVDEVMVG